MQVQPIVVPADQWAKYQKTKAQASALKRQAEAFESAWGVKSGKEYAENFALADGGKLEIPIHDGNGIPLGKLSVSWRDGYEVSPTWAKRIS